MDIFTTVWNWIKANILLSIGIGLAVLLLFFPKVLKKLFGGTTRRRRRHIAYAAPRHRRIFHSIRRHISRGPVRRTIGRREKKPWQVKGSIAARRHMARIRRMR